MENFPNHQWKSHELLYFDYRASRGKIPAAIVESVDSEGIIRRCALELDCDMQHLPGRKALDQIRELMDEQVPRYDSVELFTSGRFMAIAEGLEKKYPTLTVRKLSSFWLPLAASPSEVWADLEDCRVEERKPKKVFTENPNRRTSIEVNEPMHIFEMELEDMPMNIPQTIAGEGFEEYPEVVRLWRREGSGWPVYCVETRIAIYRTVRSGSGWRTDKVIDESLFVKRTDRKAKKVLVENPNDRAPAEVNEPIEVFEMELHDMPMEIPRIIVGDGFEESPIVIRLWRREGPGAPVFCVETEVAVYRVTYSNTFARADKVIDESLFVKRTDRKAKKILMEHPRDRSRAEVNGPIEVFEMELQDMPMEIPQIIVGDGFEEHPEIVRLWRREGPGAPVFCVETEVAVYRVTYSSTFARADKVIDESLFVKRTDRKAKKILMEHSRDRSPAQVIEVVEVYEVDLEEMPVEIPRIIAEDGFEERPEIVRLWRREGSGWPVFCVETEVAVYRVTYSHAAARADKVIDESLFIKCTDRKAKKILVENPRDRARPEVGEPIEVYEMDLKDMPVEIPQIIAEDGFEERPEIVRLWRREGPGAPVFCVETEVAVYRVTYSSTFARADKVIDESLFVKRTDRKAKKIFTENPTRSSYPEVHEGTEVFEMDLEKMSPEIPQAIADEGFEQYPEVVGLWKQFGSGRQVYGVETEAAVYRVVRSGHGWRTDKVIDESLYVKCGKLKEQKVFTENPNRVNFPDVRAETEVFEVDLAEMLPAVPQAIAAEGFEEAPEVVGLWKQHGGGAQIYCAQTRAALYRVVIRSGHGCRADKVIDEGLFIRRGKKRPYHKPAILKRRWPAYRFDLDALPPEAAEEVAEYLGLAYLPRFKAAWKKPKGGSSRIFCVETDHGFFRLSRSRHGWRVDPVDPDVAFERWNGPPPPPAPGREAVRYLIAVYSHPLEETPPEVPQAIADIRDPLRPSHLSAIWKREGSYPEVYCVKTDIGFYRVDHSLEYGWSAFRVSGDAFLKLPPKRPRVRIITHPEQMKVSDQLWNKIAPLLPIDSGNPHYPGTYTHSSRAVLNSILYRVYTEARSWKNLPVPNGLPGASACGRLRRWQKEGHWKRVRKILEEELPEGRALNWDLVEPGTYCLPLHGVAQL